MKILCRIIFLCWIFFSRSIKIVFYVEIIQKFYIVLWFSTFLYCFKYFMISLGIQNSPFIDISGTEFEKGWLKNYVATNEENNWCNLWSYFPKHKLPKSHSIFATFVQSTIMSLLGAKLVNLEKFSINIFFSSNALYYFVYHIFNSGIFMLLKNKEKINL